MIKEIFEEFSLTKKGLFNESKVEWDGIIETFVKDVFTLRYVCRNWNIEIEGTHLTADFEKPSSLPFGEKVNTVSISIKAKHPLTSEQISFELARNRSLTNRKIKLRVKSINKKLKAELLNSPIIYNYYKLPYCPESKITGSICKDHFSIQAIIFAEENQKDLVIGLMKLIDETVNILDNNWQGNNQ